MEPVEFRRRLHAHPELSFKEHATAAFIEQQLDELGIEHRRIASTGVVARIKGRKTPEGDRRAAVLRADIDALPVTERNDCEWRSQNEGVMHACGHDMHAAVLFGVLKTFAEAPDFRGTLFGLFQPGEECNPGGASLVLAEKPFGIDLPACQQILSAMREHPQVFVRCSSEFPYYPAAQQLFRWYQEGFFGRVIEARFTIKHASDMDLSKPINWKRQLKTNGAYGCMGDLGIHTQHLPFRLGFRVDSVSAQLANLVPQRPCGDGFAPCETYDNAILLCGAHNAAGDRFPMVMEMKRMAPGCTNTVEYEIYGLDGSAKFSTEDANAVWYTRNQGREQAWSRLILGQRTLFPVITGGIFEFGFSDAMLQMFAAFIAELCGEPCAFGCFRPDEALLSHQLLTGALRAYETGSVVRLD